MNLHDAQPPRFVRAKSLNPDAAIGDDLCEWRNLVDNEVCYQNQAWAIVDTTEPERGFHGVDGLCLTHVCDLHIEKAWKITTQ